MSDKTRKYGVDVALTRTDDLDRRMLQYVDEHPNCSVLEVGSGAGGQAGRLAAAGATVLAVDVIDYSEAFSELRDRFSLSIEKLCFKEGDLRHLDNLVSDQTFDIACLQRVIHYLTYAEAESVLWSLKNIIKDKLFISASGLESDIGEFYSARDLPVTARFATLDVTEAEKFSISEPICLYKPEEFIDLLQQAGWQIEECWVSAFGNIKAIVG